ncbi:MAG: class I SAM-dependent methyltransferase [Proteobacteria bacterium]|nr:class I SAM-dependent methyltransferase [Pseudomonadota bacterium]
MDEARRQSFGASAELYSGIRPGYPRQLVADVVECARITPTSRILEIGAGTGKATALFEPYGAAITAVESSPEMALVLERTVDSTKLHIICEKFEDVTVEPDTYQLIFAAQAFHWIQPEVRYRKSHLLLRSDGVLAVFWNTEQPADWDQPLRGEFDAVYARYWPMHEPAHSIEEQRERQLGRMKESGLFSEIESCMYPWDQWYSTAEYVALPQTYSEVAVMEQATRSEFLRSLERVMNHHGGGVRIPYRTILVIGRKGS